MPSESSPAGPDHCPVCGSAEQRTVNVRVPPGEAFGGGPSRKRHWGGKNVARCEGCGVIFDPAVTRAGDTNTDHSTDAE